MSLPVAAAQRRSLGTAAPHRSSHLDSMKSLRAGAFAAPSRHAMRLRTYTRAVQVSATLQRAVEAEADPAAVDRVLAAFPKDQCSADEARVLYSAGYDFLDTRSDLELESEGRVAPRLPGSLAVPLVRFAKLYDSAKGRKVVKKTLNDDFVASVGALAPSKAQGLILVCSGVPSQGQLRCRQALQLLREAGYTRLSMLDGGYAEWSLKFINKLERRVVGFSIASGGTSIEQRGGQGSKGSGVSGKSADALLCEQLANYQAGGIYADD